jgi:two-component sensor histidine kinase
VNELVQNAIEHGFIGRSSGIIGLRLSVEAETAYRLEIYDNGIGLPAGFDRAKTKSLGIQIVRTLVETDLGGTFELFSSGGTHAMITIPRT